MDNQATTQAVVTEQAALDGSKVVERFALFDSAGAPVSFPQVGGDITYAPVTTGSAIGTAGKTTTAALPASNTIVPVKFTNGNSAATPTLAFATGGAKTIKLGGTAPVAADITVAADGVVLFWFDGAVLHQLGVVGTTA